MWSGKLAFIKFQLGTLLGPEGTAKAKPLDLIRRDTGSFFNSSDLLNASKSQLLLSTARILRTTQWTRASLWKNY